MFACCLCGSSSKRFRADCGACGGAACIIESEAAVGAPVGEDDGPVRASRMPDRALERTPTRIVAWDDLLGGGAPVPSAILVAGAAGVGKTTQALSAANAIALARKRDALMVSAEMPAEMAKATALRAGCNLDRLLIWKTSETLLVLEALDRIRPAAIVWDSAQALSWNGETGTDASTRDVVLKAVAAGQRARAVTILISQVNKEGEPAGPNRIKHDVDAVLMLSQDQIVCTKSRYSEAPRTVSTTPASSTPFVH